MPPYASWRLLCHDWSVADALLVTFSAPTLASDPYDDMESKCSSYRMIIKAPINRVWKYLGCWIEYLRDYIDYFLSLYPKHILSSPDSSLLKFLHCLNNL
ncbi:hypothetical protein Ancab_014450 [Ancistrocladus abbreviatus]